MSRMTRAGVSLDEVVSNLLGAVADEMLIGLIRASYSPNIKERADCSASVFDANGETVAMASSAPLHLGALSGLVSTIRERTRRDGVAPGDAWIGNDPYVGGGTHLNDIAVVAPVVDDGEVVAFLSNLGHHADVGGRAPGSESGDNTSIFQDGLRIPAMKLADGGRVREDVVDLVLLNSRTPAERRGDLRAQLAALHIGTQRFHEVVGRYGVAQLRLSMAALMDATETRFRAAIRALPDGLYTGEDFLDDDGLGGGPVRIAVAVAIAGDRIALDFTGTDGQVPSGKNMAPGGLPATVYCGLKMLVDPDLPNNSGYYRAVSSGLIKASDGPAPREIMPAGYRVPEIPYRLNLDKAKALLADAGRPNGGFTIDYFYNTGDEEKRLIGVVFQAQAQKLGIKMNLHVTPWPTLVSKAVAWKEKHQDPPEIGAYGQHISPRYPDGAAFFQFMYHSSAQSGNGRNFMFYSNPEVDKLIDQAVAAPNDKAASALYGRAARIIVDDSPDLFLGKRLEVTVMRKDVQGYYVMPANFPRAAVLRAVEAVGGAG